MIVFTCRGFLGRGSGRAMGNSCITGASPALLRKTHDPAFKWKFYGFSALLDRGAVPAYSALFHCCGYSWFLQVSPVHKRSGDETPFVALCLSVDRNTLSQIAP
ncbi:uncharacterized protein LOC111255850 [Setaria italica]|uniref:uncharacterized protein LOC111255850 n=1 Tax=Setaria italica TaxID=4555 RepID=UPI000BE4C22D|nr:uncharacterized protein LOC111255850 [Setaria italica]XP_034573762.1 uncharacterized protein LOC117838011 [Setaria viridis]